MLFQLIREQCLFILCINSIHENKSSCWFNHGRAGCHSVLLFTILHHSLWNRVANQAQCSWIKRYCAWNLVHWTAVFCDHLWHWRDSVWTRYLCPFLF